MSEERVKLVKCPVCNGTGEKMVEVSVAGDTYWDAVDCDTCWGAKTVPVEAKE